MRNSIRKTEDDAKTVRAEAKPEKRKKSRKPPASAMATTSKREKS